MCTKFSGKTGNFDFFGPNLPQNEFWGRNFEILSPDLESAAPIYHEFFDLNFGKLPNYVRYFGSYNVEGVAKSWVEVDGGGWSWVELGARFSNTQKSMRFLSFQNSVKRLQ